MRAACDVLVVARHLLDDAHQRGFVAVALQVEANAARISSIADSPGQRRGARGSRSAAPPAVSATSRNSSSFESK